MYVHIRFINNNNNICMCILGQCVSLSLVCNGDQDCEEGGTDERHCDADNSHYVCDLDKTPPNSDQTGKG